MAISGRNQFLFSLLRVVIVALSGAMIFGIVSYIFTSSQSLTSLQSMPPPPAGFPGRFPDLSDIIIGAWISMIPLLGYFWALWAAQLALGELANGRSFLPVAAQAMRQIGKGVLAAALLNLFVVSTLSFIFLDASSWNFYSKLPSVVIGAVAVMVIYLAQAVDKAHTLQAELDEIV